jgi:transcriptional regulator with XRE-family HTH domain
MGVLVGPEEVGRRIRRLRTKARLSVRALAATTGFSPSFVSQVELGQVSPSIGSLQRIAQALGATLGEIFRAPAGPDGLVVKRRKRPTLDSAWSKARLESLLEPRPGRRLEAIFVTLRRGGRSGKRLHATDYEELAYVLTGRLVLHLRTTTERLAPGDTVFLPAGEPRLFENPGSSRVELILFTARA